MIVHSFESGGDTQLFIGDYSGTDYRHGYRFTLAASVICTDASVYIEGQNGTPTGDMTFRIETDVSNEPSGTLVHANATGTIANGDISQPAWNKRSFTPFSLAAGTYWLVVYIPMQANDQRWHQTADTDGSGTRAYMVDESGTWIVGETHIGYRRIYGMFVENAPFFGCNF